MPYTIRKMPKKPCYRLMNTKTKRVFAKCATLAAAKSQLKLLTKPYTIRKMPKKPCYRLTNTRTKRVFSKCATLAAVQSQLRLLNALKYNKSFVRRQPPYTRLTKRRRPSTR